MSQSSNIEWTDTTWNPVRGCSRVSEGCRNCYAERIAARFSGTTEHPDRPFGGFAVLTDNGPRWTGKVELIESKLFEPLHWKKPRRCFAASSGDLFHENLPDEAIDRVFAVMEVTRHITYQVLTKRAGRMREYMANHWRRCGSLLKEQGRRPLDNVWLGVSVENQPTADERIPELLRTPAALRFVSYEPALAEVDFTRFLDPLGELDGFYRSQISKGMFNEDQLGSLRRPILNWGIIGGESGPGARPFNLEWVRNTIRQFEAAGTPLFVKQLGVDPFDSNRPLIIPGLDSKGGNWEVWPEDLRVTAVPKTTAEFA
jgi:protein gp37